MVKKPKTQIGSLIKQLVDAQEILKTGKTALACSMLSTALEHGADSQPNSFLHGKFNAESISSYRKNLH